jgi:hypothetical protein
MRPPPHRTSAVISEYLCLFFKMLFLFKDKICLELATIPDMASSSTTDRGGRPGGRLIEVNMSVIFSYKTQRTLFLMHCVLLNKPNQSNIVCMNIFEDLYQHDSIPS